MIDCPNGEIRDRLPDFVHDQLDPPARAEVSAHLAACAACAAEVTLLRELRARLRAAPPVDVGRIVAALPRSTGSRGSATASAGDRRQRFDWRIAAAVAALAVGGGSAAVWNLWAPNERPANVAVDAPVPPPGERAERVERVAAADLTIDADLAEVSVAELESLLEELESFDGLPAREPEPLLPSPGNEGNGQ
jgi:anti-sigma factor RsiW